MGWSCHWLQLALLFAVVVAVDMVGLLTDVTRTTGKISGVKCWATTGVRGQGQPDTISLVLNMVSKYDIGQGTSQSSMQMYPCIQLLAMSHTRLNSMLLEAWMRRKLITQWHLIGQCTKVNCKLTKPGTHEGFVPKEPLEGPSSGVIPSQSRPTLILVSWDCSQSLSCRVLGSFPKQMCDYRSFFLPGHWALLLSGS
jgi:hypothetical protein